MDDYSQPDFYRFNRDSLELVRFIRERNPACESILDLGAGCGIIGIEISLHLKPTKLSFVEIQSDYRPYIEANLRFLPEKTQVQIFTKSFSEWAPDDRYDVIACNPPYYLPGRGKGSPDDRRAMARSFIKDDWKALIVCIGKSLSPKGAAFLVIKKDPLILKAAENGVAVSKFRANFTPFEDLIFVELTRLDV